MAIELEKDRQQMEWSAAQENIVSVYLVKAAKQKLQFLHAVDNIHYLHDDPTLDHAIYRYKYCWLPLLATNMESPTALDPLVVPLDCEWIWQCHRLNPMQYKTDCKEFYGRMLGNLIVVSTTCTKHTESIWNHMYPREPYHLQQGRRSSMSTVEARRSTQCDLAAAVKRQSSFMKAVSTSTMHDDDFLKESMARYKAFLHLFTINQERSIKFLFVPTYDIDLVWHSHQLYPVAYSNDLKEITGKLMDHNDRDLDVSKLKIGFRQSAKLWEETYGTPYLRGVTTDECSSCAKCLSCGVLT